MSAFHYIAINTSGKTVKGVLEADNPKQMRDLLRGQKLTPVEINLVDERSLKKYSKKHEFSFKRSVKRYKLSITEVALITRQIATLISSGTPIEESLRIVGDQSEKTRIKSIVLGVRSRVLEGFSFAKALEEFPHVFSKFYCNSVNAGEHSGHLDVVLNRLADYVEQQQAMRQKIQQALIYPCIMTMVSILIVIFLLLYVVPKIVSAFENTHQALPTPTVILLGISYFLQSFGVYILIGFVILGVIFSRALRREAFRYAVHKFMLRVPLFGRVILLTNTARYAKTLGVLTQAGVSVLEAMRYSSEVVLNLPIAKAVKFSADKVREGASLNYSLKQTGYFPPMSIYLISSGEASGQLGEMLERVAKNQENEINNLIEVSLRLFEPALILVMGAIVLFIVLAVMIPVFSMDQFTG